MSEKPTSAGRNVRLIDLLVGLALAIGYAALVNVGMEDDRYDYLNRWDLMWVFVLIAGLGGVLTSSLVASSRSLHPAEWLGVQTLFWNPLAWFGYLYAMSALVDSSAQASAFFDAVHPIALNCLLLGTLGLVTSWSALKASDGGWWSGVCLLRMMQAFVAAWIPIIPSVVMILACTCAWVATANPARPGWPMLGLILLITEQIAAIIWMSQNLPS